ncbi:unnamed protein product [Protopolystoma xenopodis]|uniref:Dynein heavy chain linker domain-containing protein n=1 Tax=Protopolystoma xenopodis TaxID=117903 RepID=A0A3S5CNE4_9PLAT|nr:unnamed protein product [Protopolystoma xenopodis]
MSRTVGLRIAQNDVNAVIWLTTTFCANIFSTTPASSCTPRLGATRPRLPKALRSWPAYTELDTTLHSLVGKLPLLEMLRNKAMKQRHWQRIGELTGQRKLDPEAYDVTVRMVLDLPIGPGDGAVRDEVEEVCIGAARECEIEAKLQVVMNDWRCQELRLMPFKTRGELLLKGERTQEIIQLLEDSLLVLTSLTNNRSVPPHTHTHTHAQSLQVEFGSTCSTKWLFSLGAVGRETNHEY